MPLSAQHLSDPVCLLQAEPPFFSLRSMWINSSDSLHPCGIVSRVEKGETVAEKERKDAV